MLSSPPVVVLPNFVGPTLIIAPCEPCQALLTQPALSLWRSKNKAKPAIVVAKKQVAAIYWAMPEVSEVMIAPEDVCGNNGIINLLSRLKRHTFDDSYLLCNKLRAKALTAVLTIHRRHHFSKTASGDQVFGHRSEDYAALLLNLSSVAEVPINLPVPLLRADGERQRQVLAQCHIDGELFGMAGQVSRLRSCFPIFVIQVTHTTHVKGLQNQILALCLKRWANAEVAVFNGLEIEFFTNRNGKPTSKQTTQLSLDGKLALVSLAAVVITDDTLLTRLSDAFSTPLVYLEAESQKPQPRWPSHQGRFTQSSLSEDEILHSTEKVLRFDRQYQVMS